MTDFYDVNEVKPVQPHQTRRNRMNILLLMGSLILLGLAGWMIVSQFSPVLNWAKPESVQDMTQTVFSEKTGVRVTLVALTAAGGMVDLRLQVIDPGKAVIIHDPSKPPTIIHERLKIPFYRLRHEHAHDFELHTGVIYSFQIMNGDGVIQQGDLVTIQIGDAQLRGVPVQ